MDQREQHLQLVTDFYKALSTLDTDLFWSLLTDDVTLNISGHTPISGQVRGKKALAEEILPLVFAALKLDTFQFAKKWKVVCADENRIVCIMESDGYGVNGCRYDQRYVHIFAFRDGKISETFEFFDTALANEVMFTPEANIQKPKCLGNFEF